MKSISCFAGHFKFKEVSVNKYLACWKEELYCILLCLHCKTLTNSYYHRIKVRRLYTLEVYTNNYLPYKTMSTIHFLISQQTWQDERPFFDTLLSLKDNLIIFQFYVSLSNGLNPIRIYPCAVYPYLCCLDSPRPVVASLSLSLEIPIQVKVIPTRWCHCAYWGESPAWQWNHVGCAACIIIIIIIIIIIYTVHQIQHPVLFRSFCFASLPSSSAALDSSASIWPLTCWPLTYFCWPVCFFSTQGKKEKKFALFRRFTGKKDKVRPDVLNPTRNPKQGMPNRSDVENDLGCWTQV